MQLEKFYRMVKLQTFLLVVLFIIHQAVVDFVYRHGYISFSQLSPPYAVLVGAHILIGFLTVVLSIAILVISLRSRNPGIVKSSALGLAFIIVALFGNVATVISNINPLFLFLTSLGFIFAFMEYALMTGYSMNRLP